ncbi:MAG: tail fiber protein [Bacteroidota bacterium]
MTTSWFAGNFCPTGAKCSLTIDPLKPEVGPLIRLMEQDATDAFPYLAEIRQFEVPPFGEVQWMKAEGQRLDLSEYITLYPILGDLYGQPSSRELFPLPNLAHYHDDYYICVKGGRTPERPVR